MNPLSRKEELLAEERRLAQQLHTVYCQLRHEELQEEKAKKEKYAQELRQEMLVGMREWKASGGTFTDQAKLYAGYALPNGTEEDKDEFCFKMCYRQCSDCKKVFDVLELPVYDQKSWVTRWWCESCDYM